MDRNFRVLLSQVFVFLFFISSSAEQQSDFGEKASFESSGSIEKQSQIASPDLAQQINQQSAGRCLSGFSVRKSDRSTLKAKTQIKFHDVITNAGGWDSSKHAFVAPCTGIYFFTFNALSEEGKGFTLALMKNGIYQVTAYGGKAGYQWGSNSALLFLNADDVVFLELQDGVIYEHPYNEAYTTFTGYLVNQY